MIENILISIGVPCYNAEETIGETIKSIITQTYKNWELIIIDDGSEDNSLEIIKQFCDNRITVISRENRGLPATLNEITNLAKGEFLARMDADDIMLPNRITRQFKYLQAHNDVDLLGGGIICIDNQGNSTGERFPPSVINSKYQIFKGEVVFHPTIMGKLKWFKNNLYDESYIRSEDFELWCRTAGQAVIHNIPETLLYYREYPGNTTLSKYLLQSRISRQVILKYGIEKIGLKKTYFLLFRRFVKDYVYILLKSMGLWKMAIARRNTSLLKVNKK